MLIIYRMRGGFLVAVRLSSLWIDVNCRIPIIKGFFIKIIRIVSIWIIPGCATAILLVEMLGPQFACIYLKPPLRIGGDARSVFVRTHCLG